MEIGKMRGDRGASLLSQPTNCTIVEGYIEETLDIDLPLREDWPRKLRNLRTQDIVTSGTLKGPIYILR